MSDKRRSINTDFWNDPYIESLNPSEKLLFMYFLTSPYSNLIGIYEVSKARIQFETGLNKDLIEKTAAKFSNEGKIFYQFGWVIIPKHLAKQKLNTNMKIGAVKLFNELPDEVQTLIIPEEQQPLPKDLESFETLSNHMLKAKAKAKAKVNKPFLNHSEGLPNHSKPFLKDNSNNGNNPKKDKKTRSPDDIAKEIIEYLNEKSGKEFRTSTEAHRKVIRARLNDGFTELDCQKVIDIKVSHWKDSDMDGYLRPETLFRPSKFESYLNQKKKKEKPNPEQKPFDFN